jgi:hypothetical protein
MVTDLQERMKKMKKAVSWLSVVALLLTCLLCATACGKKAQGVIEDVTKDYEAPEDLGMWKDAKYLTDTELGDGSKTLVVEVKADDRQITFTIHTDKTTVGAAMQEHGLLEGEDSEYGLFIKKVNGIVADYDVDQTYWGFYVNGEYAMTGVDSTNIEEGVTYCLARVK